MHVVVWETANKTKRPHGHQVHHKDRNTWNNDPDNLELRESKGHQSEHMKLRIKENPEWFKDFYTKGVESAKGWHSTEEGKKLHSELSKHILNIDYGSGKCPVCEKEFKKKTVKHLFCHPNCKQKDLRKRHNLR